VSLWAKVRGTIETLFQLGLGGPQLKNNVGVIEHRNAGDSAYVIARGADPAEGLNDLVTLGYILGNTLWNQTLWFIDPANSSGSASDTNDGLTSSTPLLTWRGLIRKWGTYSPVHSVATITITIMSSWPDDTDPIIYRPILEFISGVADTTAVVLIKGNLTVNQTLAEAGTVALNRATNTQLACTLGAVTTLPAGTFLQNITHSSYGWIQNRTAGKYHISAPAVPMSLPVTTGTAGAYAQQLGWVDTDSVEVMNAPFNAYIAEITPTSAGFNGLVQVAHLNVPSFSTSPVFAKDPLTLSRYVQFIECSIDRQIYASSPYISEFFEMGIFNCYVTGGFGGGVLTSSYSNVSGLCAIMGGIFTNNAAASLAPSNGFQGCFLGADVILKPAKGVVSFFGYNAIEHVDIEGICVGVFGVLDTTALGPSATPNTGIIWGSSTFDTGPATCKFLPGTATTVFPIALNGNNFGSLLINGSQRGNCIDDNVPPNQAGNLPFSGPDLDAGFQIFESPVQGGSTWHLATGSGVANGAVGGKALSELYVGQLAQFDSQPGVFYRIQDLSTDTSVNIVPNYTGTTTTTAAMTSFRRGGTGLTALSGGATFNVTNGSTTVTATGSHFTTELSVGRHVTFSSQPGIFYRVAAIASDTSLTLTVAYSGTTSAVATAQGVTLGGVIFLPGGNGSITCDAVGVS